MQLEYFQGGGIIGYQEEKTHLYIIPRNSEVQLEYFQWGGIFGFQEEKTHFQNMIPFLKNISKNIQIAGY